MNIGYITNQFPPNVTAGLGRYVEVMTPRITAAGHHLWVCTLNPGTLPIRSSSDRLTVYRPSGRVLGALLRRRPRNRTKRLDFLLLAANVLVSNLRYIWFLRRVSRDHGLDLIAVHDSTNALAALACRRLLGVPVVFHVHTVEYSVARSNAGAAVGDPFGLFGRIEAHLARVATHVVVPTPELREQLVEVGWEPGRIDVVVLGNPFEERLVGTLPVRDLSERGRALRARNGIPDDAHLLLFVGRIERAKGIDLLLEAMPAVVAADPRTRLVLLGEGDAEGVAAAVERSRLGAHVVPPLGFVDGEALLDWYAAADLCVFPSRAEPFGLVALEAMSLGKAVVLGSGFSRIFGGETTDPEQAAVRYTGPRPGDLARVVTELLADDERRARLGIRAAGRARAFRWERTAERTLAVYAEATGRAVTASAP